MPATVQYILCVYLACTRTMKLDTVFALALSGVTVFMLAACAYATNYVQSTVATTTTHCEGASFYSVKPGSSWNKRWKRFVHPPQSGNYGDVSCCDKNNGAEASSRWDALPETCPSGCATGTCSLGGCPD